MTFPLDLYHPNCRCRIMLEPPAGLDDEEIEHEVKRVRKAVDSGLVPILSPGWKMSSQISDSAPLISGTIIEVRKAFESVAITKARKGPR